VPVPDGRRGLVQNASGDESWNGGLSPPHIQHRRYAYVKQFKRTNRALRGLGTQLDPVIRDVGRKIVENSTPARDLRPAAVARPARARATSEATRTKDLHSAAPWVG
jgi:hypothetical protein